MMAAGVARQPVQPVPGCSKYQTLATEGSKVDFDTACRIEAATMQGCCGRLQGHDQKEETLIGPQHTSGGRQREEMDEFRYQRWGIIGAGKYGLGVPLSASAGYGSGT